MLNKTFLFNKNKETFIDLSVVHKLRSIIKKSSTLFLSLTQIDLSVVNLK